MFVFRAQGAGRTVARGLYREDGRPAVHTGILPFIGLCRIQKNMKATKAIPVDAAMQPDNASRETLPLYLSPVVAGSQSSAAVLMVNQFFGADYAGLHSF